MLSLVTREMEYHDSTTRGAKINKSNKTEKSGFIRMGSAELGEREKARALGSWSGVSHKAEHFGDPAPHFSTGRHVHECS